MRKRSVKPDAGIEQRQTALLATRLRSGAPLDQEIRGRMYEIPTRKHM